MLYGRDVWQVSPHNPVEASPKNSKRMRFKANLFQ